eukprot:Skav214358  [mRNA]  locus=scaffold86:517112:525846:+ [translate_table: standard]
MDCSWLQPVAGHGPDPAGSTRVVLQLAAGTRASTASFPQPFQARFGSEIGQGFYSASMSQIPAIPVILVGGVAVGAAAFQLISVGVVVLILLLCTAVLVCFVVGQRSVHFLGQDEQLVVEGFTGVYVQNGPGTFILNPFTHRSASARKAETLGTMDYLKVRHTVEGKERIEKGPQLFFLAPYEQIVERSKGLSLGSTEYALIKDLLTGERRVIKGPCMWFPGPHEDAQRGSAVSLSRTEYLIDQLTGEKTTVKGPSVWFPGPFEKSGAKMTAIALQDDECIKVKDTSSGKKWVQQGKALVFPEPTWQVEGGVRQAWALKSYEYVRLVNQVTGKVESHRGEQTVFPGPDDELLDGQVMQLIDLKASSGGASTNQSAPRVHEYVKVLDQSSGTIRVESGTKGSSKQVYLGPHDKAVEVDGEHAVLVRDKSSGQVRLVTEKQLFIPGPNESIETLSSSDCMCPKPWRTTKLQVKNKDGEFQYFYGSDEKRAAGQPRSFFLEPYAEIVKLCWSKGRRRETRNLFIERFDCRAQFMFNCRTSDNVELILEGTFFWEVVDLPAMVKSTGDTSGDLCNHARSQFIRHVARVTLKEFMDSSHAIAKKDTSFYASRGVKIHSLEAIKHKHSEAEAEVVGRAEANKEGVAAHPGRRQPKSLRLRAHSEAAEVLKAHGGPRNQAVALEKKRTKLQFCWWSNARHDASPHWCG